MQSSDRIKISVITFVYASQGNGRLELLEECLQSVKGQGHPSYEHIVVDDGSTEDVEALTVRFANTVYHRKKQSGILTNTKTFNLGHKIAKGEYLIYLASDDLQTSVCLDKLSLFLDTQEEFVGVCGGARYVDIAGNMTEYQPDWNEASTTDLADKLVHVGNCVSGCAVMWRSGALDREADLPINISGFCSDYDLWVRLSEAGQIGRISDIVVDYRAKKDSTRFKTRGGSIKSQQAFDQNYFQYSKFARVRYVKNSALKRRLFSHGGDEDRGTIAPKAEVAAIAVTVDGVTLGLDSPRQTWMRWFRKNTVDPKSQALIPTVLKAIKSGDWTSYREKLLPVLSIAFPKFSEFATMAAKENAKVKVNSITPLTAIISLYLSPETVFEVDVRSLDKADEATIDLFNWAFVDKFTKTNTLEARNTLAWLGLLQEPNQRKK